MRAVPIKTPSFRRALTILPLQKSSFLADNFDFPNPYAGPSRLTVWMNGKRQRDAGD